MERAIDPDALPVERDSGEKVGSVWRLTIKEIAELTLLKAPVQPIADARQCHRVLTRFAMTDRMKLPTVEQPVNFEADIGSAKPADHRWLLDALEDDDVREALKHDAALTSSEADGRPAHD
ncbi:hypothetical protein ABIF38_003199 [Bradyrhizobium japonicum]|uniref:Uncharacterized protein n=2 Tax=Bradyrhizobium elkanii TaxID=29448 RepID=A0ABV4FB48_BRAEL|nr:hypothetical protein [Bradyrhizobium elkanii]MBP2432193.1 hypothetical protein [Bradyrhizobium elkanii]MCP1734485.1 hypothetical protein [Bradyrhizobium elkanii]MCP1752279.1 hypothetical protein [Bradyrhizobium elkanii]MCP1978052.1 hypothetical protein [Bradyrhizobium elkanii]MCS3569823.1 hypothetical protein [Bradyrhizobium elkanii]